METQQKLAEIEQIKCLKARYCRLLDNKDWHNWRSLFADDFHSDTSGSGGRDIVGADEFVAYVRSSLGNAKRATVHQVHAPEIEILSDSEASGIWALEDIVRFFPGLNLNGFGHYHETYIKTDGRWLIRSSRLTRLRMDFFNGLFSIYFPRWLLERLIQKR